MSLVAAVYLTVHQIAPATVSQWSGSSPLAHQRHWTLTETPLTYLTLVPSHEDAVAIVPQDKSLHALQQVTDGEDIWVDKPKAQEVGLFGS